MGEQKNINNLGYENSELIRMFEHKSKLSTIIKNNWISSYKNLLFMLRDMQKSGEIPMHPEGNYLNNNELATNIYKKKYYLKDISGNLIEKHPEEVFARLSAFISAVETEEKQREWAIKFYEQLYYGYFLPGGRVIAGAGDLYRLKTLANCFVSLIEEDNIESIYKAAYECARTYSYGGGIGVDISVLRPKDSVVHNAADKSTGAVSFMEIYSLTTGLIGQSGRRGALMLTLDVKHPDVLHFIKVKNVPNWVTKQIVEQCKWSGSFNELQLEEIERQVRENTQVRFANISLKVNDEFMHAVNEENKYGRDKLLLYKKFHYITINEVEQGSEFHYSYSIPSKPIEKYEFEEVFDNFDSLSNYINRKYGIALQSSAFNDCSKRDIFGDYVLESADKNLGYELAVRSAGDFMLYFNSEQTGEIKRLVKARDVWDLFVEGNYKTAEPGLIFWSTMVKYSPSNYVGRAIASTNPCGEVPLEDGGACNLGSVNLSRFVKNGYTDKAEIEWEKLYEVTKSLTRFLDNVVTWNEVLNPLEKQRVAASQTRRLGLGIMGIADMMNQLGIAYDSEDGVVLMERVSKFIANASYEASAELSLEKGKSPIFNYEDYSKCPFFNDALDEVVMDKVKKYGLRNIAILSIAPTGTISNVILGFVNGTRHYIGVSSGIEPIFSLYYTRRSESFGNVFFKVFHSTVQAYIEMFELSERVQNAKDNEDIMKVLPSYFFRTAHYIEPSKRVMIQSIAQKYIDHSISSTVNLPEDIEPEVISNIYIDAWRNGLKGITIYRDGSRYPILSVEHKKTEFQILKAHNYEYTDMNGNISILKSDSVIKEDDGKLTTIYHALKKGKMNGRINPILGKVNEISQHKEKRDEEIPAMGNVCINCSE